MSTTVPAALPDVNAELNPFPTVQYWLDQTTDFCLFAFPDENYGRTAWLTPEHREDFFGINGGYGIRFRSRLHGFDSRLRPGALRVDQAIGEEVGEIECVCLFGPDDLPWAPGKEPEPRIYDPFKERRFVLTEVSLRFGEEGCKGYGIGRTYPRMAGHTPVTMAGGTGNITSGEGRFAGLEGTFVMTGEFTPDFAFRGQITLRMVDPGDRLHSRRELQPAARPLGSDVKSSFYVFRGEKKDRTVRTTFGPPRGNEQCLITPSQMRSLAFCCERVGHHVETSVRYEQVSAGMSAAVFFNLFAPPGTAAAPVPFTTEEDYSFLRSSGPPQDTIHAEVHDGIAFKLVIPSAPEQPAVRFAGFGPITAGTGAFANVAGMLTVNSLIGISPHVLSLVHVLHILDPDGTFRSAQRQGKSG